MSPLRSSSGTRGQRTYGAESWRSTAGECRGLTFEHGATSSDAAFLEATDPGRLLKKGARHQDTKTPSRTK